MYYHILPVRALEATNWLHPATAGTHPVSGLPVVDMKRIEAERTMVTMAPSAMKRAYKTTAVSALKDLFRGLFITRLATMG
jgi:hypothetical protein